MTSLQAKGKTKNQNCPVWIIHRKVAPFRGARFRAEPCPEALCREGLYPAARYQVGRYQAEPCRMKRSRAERFLGGPYPAAQCQAKIFQEKTHKRRCNTLTDVLII